MWVKGLLRWKNTKGSVQYAHISLVEYADIPVLDFGAVDLPGGKEKLVAQLKDAVQQTGMFVRPVSTVFSARYKERR